MTIRAPRPKDIEQTIYQIQTILQTDTSYLPERIYTGIEGISSVLLAWKKANGQPGWSKALVNQKGNPLFSAKQSTELEEAVSQAAPILQSLFTDAVMVGGASFGDVQAGPTSKLVLPVPAINPEDVSIDKLYEYITTKMDEYDEQWREISRQLGIVQAIEATDYKGAIVIPMVPPIPVPYYILGKTVLPFLNTVLDFLRLALGNPMLDFPSIRVLLSIALALLDLVRGDWQNAVLSMLGVLNSSGVVVGFVGKLIRNAWMFISPDLQSELRFNLYQSSKSMLIGFLLWAFSVFSPDFARFAVNQSFEKLKVIVEEFNQKSKDLETQVKASAEAAGIKVTFPTIPLDTIPSIDDIQNLQVIARVPEIYCSPEVQKILAPILLVPPLRLVVELLNIPTLPETREKVCKHVDTSGISKAIADKVTPTVEPLPGGIVNFAKQVSQKGGRKTRKVRKANRR
jgi:hypothetical protein